MPRPRTATSRPVSHIRTLIGVIALALVVGGCTGNDDPNVLDVEGSDFPAWSTMARLAQAESITVGILGHEVDADRAPTGFEVEVGAIVAGALGIAADDVTWVQVEPTHRERLVEDGQVDLVIAALPWSDASLEVVDLAGPYYIGGQSLLVPAGLEELADVAGTTVCAFDDHVVEPTGDSIEVPSGDDAATSIAVMPPDVELVTDNYAKCVEQLHRGDVDAVSAPDLVLASYVDSDYVLLDEPLRTQPYGIGLAKGDDEFRAFVNDVLETAVTDGRWAEAWQRTAGAVLGEATPPELNRY